MTELYSEAQIRELYNAFSIADTKKKSVIDSCNLGVVMRNLGHIITDEEVEDLMGEICDDPLRITFSDFLTLMSNKMKHVNTEEVVQEAFNVLDCNGDGLIEVEELEKSLTGLGDKLPPEEYKTMLTVMGLGVGDFVSFKDFQNIISAI